jgi:high affinity Mn2+ porin
MSVNGRRVFGLGVLTVAVSSASIAGSAAVILVALAGSASADGIMPTKAPPIAYTAAFDWSGFYVGGHVAYSLGQATSTLSDPNSTVVGNAFSSLYGGVQGGYNYVLPSRLLLGVEADFTFPNFEKYTDGLIFTGVTAQGTTVTDQIDYIATLRGRFGYAFDHWLIYGTGGFAWSQARFGETPGVVSDEDKILLTRTGWALGMGAEAAIAPNWTARIEYLYDHFGTAAGVFPSGTAYQSEFDIETLRLGLNYKLGVSNTNTPAIPNNNLWPLAPDSWNVHGQVTAIEQGYPPSREPTKPRIP